MLNPILEARETHQWQEPNGDRYGLGECPWTRLDATTTADAYREISENMYDPNTGTLRRARCAGRMYVDSMGMEAIPIGWVFEMRSTERDNPGKRIVWVEVRASHPSD